MTPPLVSILIPAFNAETWLADTLASALGQTWPRKEVIVVDDGSRDRTLEVARRFASKDVCVVTQANQGAAAARNRAFSLCQGDYIQWLDADDLLGEDKIAKQMAELERRGNDRTLLSAAWGRFMYRPDRARFSPSRLWCDLPPAEWLLRKVGENLYMADSTWLVSRKLTSAAGPWNTELQVDDDGEYFCRVLLASDGVLFVREASCLYRMTDFHTLSYIGLSDGKRQALLQSMRLHIGYLRSLEDSPRVKEACLRYLQRGLVHFYPDRSDLVKEAREIAAELGGTLDVPRLPWKYAWMASLFGRHAASRARVVLPRIKWSLLRLWERGLLAVHGATGRR